MKKVGVFICHCGINIARTVDVAYVVDVISKERNVTIAIDYQYMCSDPGQNLIRDSIRTHSLDAIVVACCSPALHKLTFMKVAQSAGLNKYCTEIANIREQCSWVHEDREEATHKAIWIVRSAVAHARMLKPLDDLRAGLSNEALVIGAGIAGIQAAIDIADAGFKVHLVERESSVGGHMAQLDKTFPTLDCSACILTPKMVAVSQHENINLLTYAEVENIDGFVGNFEITVKLKDRYVDEERCTGCDLCTQNCLVKYVPQKREKASVKKKIDENMRKYLDEVLLYYGKNEKYIVQMLLDVNSMYKYLPENALRYLSEELEIPLSTIYQISTFYTAFSLTPRGKHIIKVCMGTACHSKGAPRVMDEIERILGIRSGETSQDMKYTLETVNCLGCCALGPVVTIDDKYFHADPADVQGLLESELK